jgi:hypothetical protein
MSGEEKQFEDVSDVEAALRSLAPRSDRLDRERLMFLAGQASAGGRGDMPTTSVGISPALAASVRMAPDTAYRDMPTTSVGMAPRWAWPSAFAAMSAVAATLLVALLVRPGAQVVERIVKEPVPGTRSPEGSLLAEDHSRLGRNEAQPQRPDAQEAGAAPRPISLSGPPRIRPAGDPYHELLERVLDHGLDAWKAPAGGVTVTAAAPVTYRGLLETLLESPSS